MANWLDRLARLFDCDGATHPGIYLIGYECWGYVLPASSEPPAVIKDHDGSGTFSAPAFSLTA